MGQFTTIKHVRTYMEVVEQISKMIHTQQLLPGEKLPSERALSSELGIGRQCLREALSVLEVLGLIEVKKGRGTFVCENIANQPELIELDIEEFGDPFALMEVRKTIEARTAFLAAQMAQPEDLAELDGILAEMAEITNRGGHASEEDKKLHLIIAQASKNPVFHKLMSVIIANMGKRLWLTLKDRSLLVKGRNERYYEEHVKLVEAIRQGNPHLARKIMIEHLNRIEQDLSC